jgi:hypothetical protein
MKKLLLVFALFSLFSCGNDEEVKTINENSATISVKHDGQYSMVLAYLSKDKWEPLEPYIFGKIVKGDTTVTVNIDREQNFVYIIQRQGANANTPLEANITYRDKNSKKIISTPGGQLWDIYEFYTQIF